MGWYLTGVQGQVLPRQRVLLLTKCVKDAPVDTWHRSARSPLSHLHPEPWSQPLFGPECARAGGGVTSSLFCLGICPSPLIPLINQALRIRAATLTDMLPSGITSASVKCIIPSKKGHYIHCPTPNVVNYWWLLAAAFSTRTTRYLNSCIDKNVSLPDLHLQC